MAPEPAEFGQPEDIARRQLRHGLAGWPAACPSSLLPPSAPRTPSARRRAPARAAGVACGLHSHASRAGRSGVVSASSGGMVAHRRRVAARQCIALGLRRLG
jgi:hypothetical protein